MSSRANRILTRLFAALIVVNLFYLLLGFLSIPVYYERVTTLTIQAALIPGANYPTNAEVARSAAAQGLTLPQYAAVQIAFHSVIVFIFLSVATVIVVRARRNWFAWYSAFFLIFIAEFAFYDEVYIARLLPVWVYEAGSLFWPLILPYFFLFPNGRPAPLWARWVVFPASVLHAFLQTVGFLLIVFPALPGRLFFESVIGPFQIGIIGGFVFILGCQVYRYRRISTHEEKLQTKWFLMGFGLFLALSVANGMLGAANPYNSETDLAIFVFVPLSLAVAILRYRLWDIDLIIRRTLQYSLVTVLLGMVYFGGVTLLQSLFTAVSGQQSPAALVLSTLLIAALFNPLRRSIQDFIDRRFYRQKYDAEKALAQFSAITRNNVEMDNLAASMLSIVEGTMRPEKVSLWINRIDQTTPQKTHYSSPQEGLHQ